MEIWPKRRHFSVLPGNTKWYVTSHTRWRQGDICKYRWTGRRCRSLTPRAGQALSAWGDYKPREARRLWRLTSLAIHIWLIDHLVCPPVVAWRMSYLFFMHRNIYVQNTFGLAVQYVAINIKRILFETGHISRRRWNRRRSFRSPLGS